MDQVLGPCTLPLSQASSLASTQMAGTPETLCVSGPCNGSIPTQRYPYHPWRSPRHLQATVNVRPTEPLAKAARRGPLADGRPSRDVNRDWAVQTVPSDAAAPLSSPGEVHVTGRSEVGHRTGPIPMPTAHFKFVSWHNFRTPNPIHIRRGQSTGI